MSESSRARILARVRGALAHDESLPPAPERHLAPAPSSHGAAAPAATFRQRAEKAAATVEEITEWREVPPAVERFGRAIGDTGAWSIAPGLADLPWPPSQSHWVGGSRGEESLGVAVGRFAVAETGSLVFVSGPRSPVSLLFLPRNLVAAVEWGSIVSTQEEVWQRLRDEVRERRSVHFVTGPSRTADVEQTLQLGAHGPCRLHILLVTGPARG